MLVIFVFTIIITGCWYPFSQSVSQSVLLCHFHYLHPSSLQGVYPAGCQLLIAFNIQSLLLCCNTHRDSSWM